MNHHFNSPYLTIHETSDYVRLAKRTIDNMRYMGTGPMFQKHNGKVFHTSMNSKSGHRKAALIDVKCFRYWSVARRQSIRIGVL
jgi:hypothetical protein